MTAFAPDDWHRLFSAALDERLSDTEREQLTTLLATSAEARRLWFLYHDNECSLAARAPTVEIARSQPAPSASFRRRWLAAAAACFAFGMFCASAVFAYFLPNSAKVTYVLQESFETSPAPDATGIPRNTVRWNGDFSEIATAGQDWSAADGNRVLRFLRGDHEGMSARGGHSSDVLRLIDVRPFRSEFADGSAVVQLTARFNAAVSDPQNPTFCTLMIFALDAAAVNDPELTLSQDSLAYSSSSRVWLDNNPTSWQTASNELRVPPETDFIMIRLGVSYDIKQKRQHPDDFPGHLADQVNLVLTHRPGIAAP